MSVLRNALTDLELALTDFVLPKDRDAVRSAIALWIARNVEEFGAQRIIDSEILKHVRKDYEEYQKRELVHGFAEKMYDTCAVIEERQADPFGSKEYRVKMFAFKNLTKE